MNDSNQCRAADSIAKAALRELAVRRQLFGLPPAGSPADRATLAKLETGGQEFWGENAHGRTVGLVVNAISRTHAEADVFEQARVAGVRATTARLVVDRELCRACGRNGAVRSMACQIGIEQLEIITPASRHWVDTKPISQHVGSIRLPR